jgi:hypothetical protein
MRCDFCGFYTTKTTSHPGPVSLALCKIEIWWLNLTFNTEPSGYIKTALSDLQGSWGNLRTSVTDDFGFSNSDKLLFHIDEAMSWESVRDLDEMKSTLLLINNIAMQESTPEEVLEWIADVRECLDVVFSELAEGKIK